MKQPSPVLEAFKNASKGLMMPSRWAGLGGREKRRDGQKDSRHMAAVPGQVRSTASASGGLE